MDFGEGGEEPDAEAWETEDEEGGGDGMEPQDDSEVTFSLHSGECRARALAAGVSLGTCLHTLMFTGLRVCRVRSLHTAGSWLFLGWSSELGAVLVYTLHSGREAL